MCGACRVHLLAHIDTHPTEPLVYIPLNPIARLDSPSTAARDFEFQMSPVLGRRRPEVTDGGPTTARRRDAMTMGDGKTQNARVQLHPAWRTPGQSRPAGCGCAEAGSFKEGSPQQEERIPSPRVACSFPRSWSPGLSTPGLLATLASSFHPAAGGAGGPRLQPEKSCPDRLRSSRGSHSAGEGGPGYGAAGAGPGLAMGSVTAGTMRPEGAAPGWAARYRVLSLVLAALMGQDSGPPQQLPAIELRLETRRGSPPRSPAASLRERGEAWLSDSGSGLNPKFYMELRTPDLMQLRGAERTPVSRGPFSSFEKPRTFRPTLDRAVALEASGRSGFQRVR
ncbi:hypothetical protein NN561_013068 [Cricetulus griseus]